MRSKMKKRIFMIFVIQVFIMFVFSQSRGFRVITRKGDTIKLYEKSYALVIGVSDYVSGWPDLPEVIKDLKEVEKALKKHGFSVNVIKDPRSSELVSGINDFTIALR